MTDCNENCGVTPDEAVGESCEECKNNVSKECPWCHGSGRYRPHGFACGSSGCKVMTGQEEMKCPFCGGTGELSQWAEQGKHIYNTRVAGRGQPLRHRAEELGISPVLLSDIEHGRANPKIYYSNKVVRQECDNLKKCLSNSGSLKQKEGDK